MVRYRISNDFTSLTVLQINLSEVNHSIMNKVDFFNAPDVRT